MLRFNRATYLSLLFKFILSVRLNSLGGADVLPFLEFDHFTCIVHAKI